MRSEAFKLTSVVAVISAVGFLFRWLQDMRIADEETGLAPNALISWLVILIIAATALLLAGYLLFYLRQFDAPTEPEKALAAQSPFFGIISLIPSVLLALAGAMVLISPGEDVMWPGLHRLCGGAAMAGAFGSAVIAVNAPKEDGAANARKGALAYMLFALIWLITGYRDAATDPQIWRFVVEIFAQCAVLLAGYYFSGYFFHSAHPWGALFTCSMAVLLCVMSAIDDNGIGMSLMYASVAVQMLLWVFSITENLKTKPLTPAGPEERE